MDKLFDACFNKICLEILDVLSTVEYQDQPNEGGFEGNLINIWETYITYLQEHPKKARFYFFRMLKDGGMLPEKPLPRNILRCILGDRYDDIAADDDAEFVTMCIIYATNGVAQGIINGILKTDGEMISKLREMVLSVIREKSIGSGSAGTARKE